MVSVVGFGVDEGVARNKIKRIFRLWWRGRYGRRRRFVEVDRVVEVVDVGDLTRIRRRRTRLALTLTTIGGGGNDAAMLVQPNVDGEAHSWDVLDVHVYFVEEELAWWRCVDDAVGEGAWRLAGAESMTWSE